MELLKIGSNDPSGIVRLEAAIAASYIGTAEALEAALDLLKHPMDSYLTYALRQRGHDCVGIDISESAVQGARRNFGPYYEVCDVTTMAVDASDAFDVIVATELIHDPLLKTISQQTDDGTVAHLIAADPQLPVLVETMIEGYGGLVRPGLTSSDVAKFVVSTALSMLLGVIPGTDSPDTARRYLRTFVLPAILVDPPAAEPVFAPSDPPPRRRRVGSAE